MKYCNQPDIDSPKMECGHPLPCPRHPVKKENVPRCFSRYKDSNKYCTSKCSVMGDCYKQLMSNLINSREANQI
jgi:hypothetical protein